MGLVFIPTILSIEQIVVRRGVGVLKVLNPASVLNVFTMNGRKVVLCMKCREH